MELKGYNVMEKNYKEGKSNLIGFLPERRKNPERERGRKAILKLAHKMFSGTVKDIHSIYLTDVFK